MSDKYVVKISNELNITQRQVAATLELLEQDATIPFIARYRKEATGNLDEIQITDIRDRSNQLKELDKRRDAILKSLEERELLTDDLKSKVLKAETMSVLEDIYLPFKPKRRTRATIAKEKGLEPLAKIIFEQTGSEEPLKMAEAYLNEEKEVASVEDALKGARDIIAEWVNENQEARAKIRHLYVSRGIVKSEVHFGKEDDGKKYKDYFDLQESVDVIPSHRILAIMRGQREKILSVSVSPPEDDAIDTLNSLFLKEKNSLSEQVELAIKDSFKRLMSISMETEIRMMLKERADVEAIKVFSDNVRQLLLYPPLGEKNVMAIDPGFRTGCKVVCLNSQGKLLHNDAIYPHPPQNNITEAANKIQNLVNKYNVEVIAVGNGTAGRETETFLKRLDFSREVHVVMVNESGASIYSASKAARDEFAEYDVTVRGAVSIGRRLMDPLAELVKIDPKSIGVGQYQHDVNQKLLQNSLDDVVVSCVNAVGVELNTASKELLTYVSGLNERLAKSIVNYRNENGAFKSRKQLNDVPFLGPKAFEQSSGFLRIRNAENPLDESAVHPESYSTVNQMAQDLSCDVSDLMKDEKLRKKIDINKYVTDSIGLPTLGDILSELDKPGRDPRKKLEIFQYSDKVQEIGDLKPGMKLPGIVTNITAFGAFVDVGVHQDGLVHISQIADEFVSNPNDILNVQQQVMVTVMEVDVERKRISLSMKSNPEQVSNAGGKSSNKGQKKVVVKRAVKSNAKPTLDDLKKKFSNR